MFTAGGIGVTLIGYVLSFLASFLSKTIMDKRADRAKEQLGREKQANEANKEASEAQDRMSQANAEPRSRQTASDRLKGGTA